MTAGQKAGRGLTAMNCKQFQEDLPNIIESGGNAEQESHLRSCPYCSDLVRDLKYIAEQAKLLLPMHDPAPRVWTNIEQSLQREGLFREGRTSRLGHITAISPIQKKNWTPLGVIIATAAVLTLALVLINYRPTTSAPGTVASATVNGGAIGDSDDAVLVSEISSQDAELGKTYAASLKEINGFISDAEQAANADPEDSAARDQLKHAYHQKAVLYEMAIARSMQ
jgi:hypothetical protein